jgi:glutamyl-tRNA reductase
MDQTRAIQAKNYIPKTLKRPEEVKRTKEIVAEKSKELLNSLNDMEIVKKIKKEIKKIKDFIEEYSNLDEKHDKLVAIFDKTEKEIKELMPAFRVEK